MSQTKAQLLDGKSATIQYTAGSASAPAISFTSDTNTGIYSPGADQVAISTNGVQRLTVSTTGTESTVPLSVYTSSAGASLVGLSIVNNSDNASTASRITLQPSTTFNRGCHIEAVNSGTSGQPTDLIFGTNPASSTSTERLRITSDGKVGLGTSTPVSGAQLTVAGASLAVTGQNTDHSANSIRIGEEGSGAAQIRCYGPNTSTNGSLTFRMSRSDGSNSQDVVIDSSGRLGIGTASPAKALHVNGDIRLPTDYTISWGDDACRIFRATNDLRIDVGSSERARIDSSGRLLVGTSSSSGVNSNTAPVLAGNFASFTGSVSANHSTATTLFTLENLNATYMVTAVITGTANAAAYHAVYIIGSIISNSHSIQALKAGSLLTLSLSGADVQATQGSGVAQTVTWSVTRMAHL